MTQENLADECGIRCLTVGDIKKNEDKIRLFAPTMESVVISKKRQKVMCLADDVKLNKAVYLWFVQKRTQDIPLAGQFFVRKLHSFMCVAFTKMIQSLSFSYSFIHAYTVLYYTR